MAEAYGGGKKPIDFGSYIGGEEALADAQRKVRALNKDVAALSKTVADDSGRIAAGFATINKGIADIQAKAGKLNLFSGEDKAVLAALAQQLGELKKRQDDYKATQAAQATVQRGLTDVAKQYTSELAKQKDALRAAALANDVEGQKAAAAAIRQTTQETAQLSKALRGANSEFTAAKGSYDALVIENNKLLASLHALEGGLLSGSQEALKLKKQIYDNTQTLKDFDEATNRNFRSVGDYKSGYSNLIAELAKARVAQQNYTEGSAQAAAGQQRIIGFQTAAQKALAGTSNSYESVNAAIEQQVAAVTPLAQALNRLQKQQIEIAESAGQESAAYRKIGFQISQTEKSINDLTAANAKAADSSGGLTQQLGFSKEGLKQFAIGLATGAVGLQAIVTGVSAAFGADSEFQTALSSLSALTGATGEDLQFLADKAQELGPTVGKSATEVLKAFELIGSAQPDLLKNKDALAEVTEQVLLLAAASGDDLPAAAEALTGVMNQFQAPAAEAARYVNALAAGAKEGAATIPQAAASLKYFGVNAASANISVEKSVALIQTLAERSIKGEQAGTQLRNILAKLASGAKETNPEVVGLSTALDNLGKKNLTTAQYTKLFGLENANTAKILVENRDKVEQLTVAVTGTQTASEQAAKQLDNISTASSRFGSVLKNLVINSLDGVSRAFGSTLNQLSSLLSKLSGNTKTIQENTAATTANGLANEAVAKSAQTLLARYQELTAQGVKPAKDGKGELNLITLQLRDSLGESAAAIDKETGQLVLNEEATKRLIKQKLLLSNQAVSSLVLQADALKDQGAQTETQIKALEQEIATREKLLGITAEQARQRVKDFAENSVDGVLDAGTKQAEQLYKSAIALGDARAKLKGLRGDYDATLASLDKFGAKQAYLAGGFSDLAGTQADAAKKVADATLDADAQLDRAAQERAKNRASQLRDELADNQTRLAELRKYQAEQAKLFADKQLTPEIFAERVRGSEDLATQLERDGTAIRIKIVRAEAAEKLEIAENDRIRQSKKKNITEEELADIQGQAAARRVEIRRQEARKIDEINREATERQGKVEPLEFKVNTVDFDKLERDIKERTRTYEGELSKIKNAESATEKDLLGSLSRREISQNKFDNRRRAARKTANDSILALDKEFHKANLDDQKKANEDILETQNALTARRIALIDKVGQYTQFAEASFFQIKSNFLDAQAQNEQAAYENSLAAAGENKELREAIEKAHQKELKRIAYERAKAERDQALYSIAISVATAVAKDVAQYGFFLSLPAVLGDLAVGAVQAGVVLTKPLPPQYFKGRKGGPAEWAIVGDRGPELVHEKKTGRYTYEAKPTLRYLGAGDDVLTAAETSEALAKVGLRHSDAQQPMRVAQAFSGAAEKARESREAQQSQGLDSLAKGQAEIAAALRKFKPTTVNVHRGSDADVQVSNNITRYRSQRLGGDKTF